MRGTLRYLHPAPGGMVCVATAYARPRKGGARACAVLYATYTPAREEEVCVALYVAYAPAPRGRRVCRLNAAYTPAPNGRRV